MIWQIGHDDPVCCGYVLIIQNLTPLLAIGSGRVLTHEWDALPGLLEVNPIFNSLNFEVDIFADRCFEFGHVTRAPPVPSRYPFSWSRFRSIMRLSAAK